MRILGLYCPSNIFPWLQSPHSICDPVRHTDGNFPLEGLKIFAKESGLHFNRPCLILHLKCLVLDCLWHFEVFEELLYVELVV